MNEGFFSFFCDILCKVNKTFESRFTLKYETKKTESVNILGGTIETKLDAKNQFCTKNNDDLRVSETRMRMFQGLKAIFTS